MYNNDIIISYIKGYCKNNNIKLPDIDDNELISYAKDINIKKLHCFKNINDPPLERVQKLIKLLNGLDVQTVVDFGTQRGALLWPLMHAYPHYDYIAIDLDDDVVKYLNNVVDGGIKNLSVMKGDITKLNIDDNSADIVIASEILEHLKNPELAAMEAIRIAKKYIYITVPLKKDDNPEHINLFTSDSLTKLFVNNKVKNIKISYLFNNIIAFIILNK